MTVDFSDHFWGSKNNGFDVLYHNMKYGLTASKELGEFFREKSALEEAHSKSLTKLAKIAGNGSPNGTFAPFWTILRSSTEKLSSIHMQMMGRLGELVKDLAKYADDLGKKCKAVKEEEAGTLETVQVIQTSTANVQKAKEVYFARAAELEKLHKDNGSAKDIEKAEVKVKKSYEEYKTAVEKYSQCREEFDRKMTLACKHFQEVEFSHLSQMKDFLDTYASVIENNHEIIGQVHLEFRRQCSELSVDSLLEQFIAAKATGPDKPGSMEIEEMGNGIERNLVGLSTDEWKNGMTTGGEKKREGNTSGGEVVVEEIRKSRRTTSLLNLFIPSQGKRGVESPTSLDLPDTAVAPQPAALSRTTPNRGSKWFLLSRRDKKNKEKKGKKKDASGSKEEKSDQDESKGDSLNKSESLSADIDEEGFSVRPTTTWESDKFYSSSDDDSEDEREKRLHVEIKPITNGTAPLSASVDELRSTVENMTLSPLGIAGRKAFHDAEAQMKRSQSVSQQLGSSSPPSRHPYTPLSPPPQPEKSPNAQGNDASNRYADLGDLFAEVGEIQPSLPPKLGAPRNTPTPTSGLMAIPRPPSRPRPERNTSSPSPAISRTESIGSLDTRSVGSYALGSRGPSPLTIGMSNAIPLAVAFHEIIHACFRSNDETKCQVKMTGDLMVSFPAGIIQVFASNPNPAQLTFRVRSMCRLEGLASNKDLVTVQRDDDELSFEFNMSALTILLRKHSEQNPSASYFNVDILKYQIAPKEGAGSCPLQLVSFWKCEENQTDLRIDYKYNGKAMGPFSPEVPKVAPSPEPIEPINPPLLQVCVAAPVDGGVKTMQSKPTGQWYPNTNRACWKLPNLSSSIENPGVGSFRARFEISNGPSSQGTIAAQFSCENSTLSGSEFQLSGTGYRVSLIKKRFVSGKYTCDSGDISNRYAVPIENATEV